MKKIKRAINRYVALFLSVLAIASLFTVSASAASGTAWPNDISESNYIEMRAVAKQNSYMDSGLSTRGTFFPSKGYNSYIDAGDLLYLYEVTPTYTKASFPTPSGRRIGFFSTKLLFGVSTPRLASTALTVVKTYTDIACRNKTGSVFAGEQVLRLGEASGSVFILYPAESGARGYKCGFVSKSVFSQCFSESNSANGCSAMTTMSYALYQSSGGRLTCGFAGYVNTPGYHEGIDIAKSYGSPIYSLTDGTIINIVEGANGSRGLSTIAIYMPSSNKTVLYLHADPLDSLKVGQSVSRGQQIATEAWRGVSSASGTHTHVEMRDGWKRSAAKSVNDYTQDNANPSSFWRSQGYIIK